MIARSSGMRKTAIPAAVACQTQSLVPRDDSGDRCKAMHMSAPAWTISRLRFGPAMLPKPFQSARWGPTVIPSVWVTETRTQLVAFRWKNLFLRAAWTETRDGN